jgi:hypothetical protein
MLQQLMASGNPQLVAALQVGPQWQPDRIQCM